MPCGFREQIGPPDFQNLVRVLECKRPDRPVLFEFFLNQRLYARLASNRPPKDDGLDSERTIMHAFHAAGYDYATLHVSFHFPVGAYRRQASLSLNEKALITDRDSFRAFAWPEPDEEAYTAIDRLADELPEGMRFIVPGPGGVLENLVSIVGFDNLCFMLADDPRLVADIVDAIGSRLVKHYELVGKHTAVGAMISNDDWGFKTQTMLRPDHMRQFIFPWHKRIVHTIHDSGRPAILHSCGFLEEVMETVIGDMGYDGKHSFEDAILPVEAAYKRWGNRIAILGGIDLDFICRRTPHEIADRSRHMLEQAQKRGAYALGSGNSIPEYCPDEHYLAMIGAAGRLKDTQPLRSVS